MRWRARQSPGRGNEDSVSPSPCAGGGLREGVNPSGYSSLTLPFEPSSICRKQAHRYMYCGIGVVPIDHLAMLVQPGQPRPVLWRDVIVREFHRRPKARVDNSFQLSKALACDGGNCHGSGSLRHERHATHQIRLVEHLDGSRLPVGCERPVRHHVLQYRHHVGTLRAAVRMGGIAHVQNHIGLRHLLECGAERLDQFVRQFADEADSVRQNRAPSRRQAQPAHCRVEGGK